MERKLAADKVSDSIDLPSNLKGNYKEEYYEKSLKPQFSASERREKAKRDAIEKYTRFYGHNYSKISPEKVPSSDRKRNRTTIDSKITSSSLTSSTTISTKNEDILTENSTVINFNATRVTSKNIFKNINEEITREIRFQSSSYVLYNRVKLTTKPPPGFELSDLQLCDGSGDDIDPNEVLKKIRKLEIIAKYYFVISSHIGIGLWDYSSTCIPEYLDLTIRMVPITRSTVFESNDFYATMVYDWINTNDNNNEYSFVIQYTRGLKRFIMSKYPRFLMKAVLNSKLVFLGDILYPFSSSSTEIVFCFDLYVNILRGRTWNMMTSLKKPVCFIFRYYGSDKSNNNDNSLERFTVQVTKWPHENASIANENLTSSFEDKEHFLLFNSGAYELFIHKKKCWIIQNSSGLHGLTAGIYGTKVLLMHLKESAELDYLYTIYYKDKETNHILS
jgi:hypothetical protein